MAIVVDLNGTPPGRAGNQVGIDPHNMSKLEYAHQNDGVRNDASVHALAIGLNQILIADGTRGTVTIVNPKGNDDVAVGVTQLSSITDAGAHTIFNGNGYTWKGEFARKKFYCYSPAVQSLTILVG